MSERAARSERYWLAREEHARIRELRKNDPAVAQMHERRYELS